MFTKKIFSKNSYTQFSRQVRNDDARCHPSLSRIADVCLNELTYVKANDYLIG